MAIVNTIVGKKVFKKPTKILFTPYEGDTLSSTTYALDNIVADSTSITQDEAERNTVDCETRDEAIDESVTLGSYQFTCNNADWQEQLVVALLGFTKKGNILAAPSSYVETYAQIEIQFGDAKNVENYGGSVVLPRVLLTSAATMESLKTNVGKMTVSGTAYSWEVGSDMNTVLTPFYISSKPVTTA